MPITTAGTAWFLVKADDVEAVNAAIAGLATLPGVREVRSKSSDSATHLRLTIIGTDKGKRLALRMAELFAVAEADLNADHDHAACLASARKLGIPEAYAHTPETYLSM